MTNTAAQLRAFANTTDAIAPHTAILATTAADELDDLTEWLRLTRCDKHRLQAEVEALTDPAALHALGIHECIAASIGATMSRLKAERDDARRALADALATIAQLNTRLDTALDEIAQHCAGCPLTQETR